MSEKGEKACMFILCLVIVFAVAYIGSLFTQQGVNTEWYKAIKPHITPPDFVFSIVWTMLFLLIAISLFLVWVKSGKMQRRKIAVVYGANLLLNVLWSFLFFTLKNPALALVNTIALFLSIIAMIIAAWEIDRKASYLLIPYLLWVGFAIFLNCLAV